jgi:Rhodopirellula transposase DDE domain
LYTTAPIHVQDHDFPSLATGIEIPHGLYDLTADIGYIQIGISHETSEFTCDAIRDWWQTYGKVRYPLATSILLLCDGGGSHDARHYIFKQDLQALVNEIGIEIRIAHYPPYTSKYNPIEHRLFPHITRACQGVILQSVQCLQDLIAKTRTRMGLQVFATLLDKPYQTGRKAAANFKATMKIIFDTTLPRWNYVARPELQVI